MFNAVITALNALSSLLNEIEEMINGLVPQTFPTDFTEEQVEIIFDISPIDGSLITLPRRAKIVSMLPMRVDTGTPPSESQNLRLCTSVAELEVTINVRDYP